MKLSFLGLFIFLLSTTAFANKSGNGGVYVGNGGAGVQCIVPQPSPIGGTDVFMMDYWLAASVLGRFELNIEIQRFENLKSFRDSIEFFSKKLELAPSFYRDLKEVEKNVFFAKSSFIQGPLLTVVEELSTFSLPKECQKVQIAVRRADQIFIDKDLFKQMEPNQKALLVMHEYIYALGVIKYKHNSSGKTQELLSYLLRKNPTAKELEKYLAIFFKAP